MKRVINLYSVKKENEKSEHYKQAKKMLDSWPQWKRDIAKQAYERFRND